MTTKEPRIVFIDSEKKQVTDLIIKLQSTFNETSVSHVTHITALDDIYTSKRINILFFAITAGDAEKSLQLFTELSQKSENILIAAIPEDNSELTARVIEYNPFFHITKPYDFTEVRLVLKRALEKSEHLKKINSKKSFKNEYCGIIGRSPAMKTIFELISMVAEDDISTVLIRGESGTGKELVAKAIHQQSQRKKKNFVPVNCAAIPDDLLESELFGHTKGAFTGANQNKIGRIQYAEGGTLFLDEIGDMKPNLQAKLLRVLQEKEFEPVGGLQATRVDTRILAATHCDLEQLVNEGAFREDLYYRLSVIPVNIPPLKSRKEDIPLLLESFIDAYTTDRRRERFSFSNAAMDALLRYNWRGNVRELENLVQHMSVLFSGKTVELNDLPEKYLMTENQSEDDISYIQKMNITESQGKESPPPPPEPDIPLSPDTELDFKEMINEFETKLIVNALRATDGNKKEAARLLKLKRTTLLEKIKKKKLGPDHW
ncbi:MAG: sigma-54 dependent transcriptional regulator [Desulfocapsaceae bacterium]|nr:sigma-54 dependent transcriptional regulator [Desulfocapsaceae bacterium]